METSGLKKTEPRLLLVDLILDAKKPLSASEIFAIFKIKKIDKVTVYRTLETLEEKGFIKNSLIKKALAQTKEFKNITHHSFDLFGVCIKCAK